MAEKRPRRKNDAANPQQNQPGAQAQPETIRMLFVEDTTGEQYECNVPVTMKLSQVAGDFFESQEWKPHDEQGRARRAVIELVDKDNRDRTQRLRLGETVGEAGLQDGDILRIFPESVAAGPTTGRNPTAKGMDFHETLVEAVAQCIILNAGLRELSNLAQSIIDTLGATLKLDEIQQKIDYQTSDGAYADACTLATLKLREIQQSRYARVVDQPVEVLLDLGTTGRKLVFKKVPKSKRIKVNLPPRGRK